MPQPIENIVGQSFCFGISITNDNVSNGSVTFKVSEVWCGDKIQKIESQTEPSSCFDTNSSTLSGGEVSYTRLFIIISNILNEFDSHAHLSLGYFG